MVEKQILEELRNGRYILTNRRPRIISALGAIPKNGDGSKVRLIHDCSRPTGSALNDLTTLEKFCYQSVQDAVKLITPGCYMSKIDLSAAYRSVKISATDYEVSGLSWDFEPDKTSYIYDTRLMFGARLAPGIFTELSQAVCRIYKKGEHQGIISYLDDFLLVSPDYLSAKEHMRQLMALLRRLGFAISFPKLAGPAQKITFLGVELNSVTGTLGLPQDKLQSFISDVQRMYDRKSATKREFQSMAGKLCYMSQVIHAGRPFFRRILDRIKVLKHPAHRSRITRDIRLDLAWWINFAQIFNGTVPMLDQRPSAPVCVDACNRGGGGYFGAEFFNIQWSQWPGSEELHINYKEVLALEPAFHLWAPSWANKIIRVYSDNKTAVSILNRGYAKHPFVMASLRRMWWLSAVYNFRICAIYYPGFLNRIADACSRFHEASAQRVLYDYFVSPWAPHRPSWTSHFSIPQ